jgi:hypothetical protein
LSSTISPSIFFSRHLSAVCRLASSPPPHVPRAATFSPSRKMRTQPGKTVRLTSTNCSRKHWYTQTLQPRYALP